MRCIAFFFSRIGIWLTGEGVQRFIFAILRVTMPVLVIGKKAIIAKNIDVREVLRRDSDFTISEINSVKMEQVSIKFFLGMDRSPQHDRELAFVEKAVRRDDLDRIRTFVRNSAVGIIKGKQFAKQIDVSGELARIVPLRLVDKYFGVPGPSEETMKYWMRILFHQLFLNLTDDKQVFQKALAASKDLKDYLEKLIRERKISLAHGRELEDTVLSRMIKMQKDNSSWLDDDTIRRNICGLIIGAVDTTNKVVSQVVDVLLARPKEFSAAREAAKENDMNTVSKFTFEALRFNVHNSIVSRYCRKETSIGQGTKKPKRIAANTTVYASILSAMFDSEVFVDPGRFDPFRKAEYLHFSDGLHQCFGRYINAVQIPELVASILRLNNVRRASCPDGWINYDGSFPNRLILKYDP